MLGELDVLVVVTGRLESAAIPYMVTGAMAASHYGRPRMTRDIDIVTAVTPADADRLIAAPEDLVLSKLVCAKDSDSPLQLQALR